jgi:hypothetical protein
MKPCSLFARAALGAAALLSGTAAWSAVDVGVGVTIREPGVYGRIEIGTSAPPPPVVYRQPVIVQQPAVIVTQQPLYLYVPPGHAKKWRKHCHQYDACGRQVYFVKEEWVQAEYSRSHQGKGPPVHAQGRGHGKGKNKRDD